MTFPCRPEVGFPTLQIRLGFELSANLSGNFGEVLRASGRKEMFMRSYLANVPPVIWALIALPALVVTRSVLATVVPAVWHAVVPDVVRTVLRLI